MAKGPFNTESNLLLYGMNCSQGNIKYNFYKTVYFSSVAIVLEYAALKLSESVTDLKRQFKVRKNG